MQQGTHTAASASITVAEAFQQWIAAGQANGLEHGSIRQRRQHLRCHVAPYLGGAKLAELTLPRVNKFLDTLRDNGRSTVMRRKVLTSVKSAISYAQGQGWCAQNVARGATPRTSGARKGARCELVLTSPARRRLRRCSIMCPMTVAPICWCSVSPQ